MTDFFFCSVTRNRLNDALRLLQSAITEDIRLYKDKLHEVDGGNRDAYDYLVKFDIKDYTILQEMVRAEHEGIIAGPQQQSMTLVYTVVALVIVNDDRAK